MDVFTRYLALELGIQGVPANLVAPGAVFGGETMQDNAGLRGRVGLPGAVCATASARFYT